MFRLDDDRRLQTYDDEITAYLYGTPAIKVCESKMLSKNKLSRPNEDKNTLKDEDKDKDKYDNRPLKTFHYVKLECSREKRD